MCMPTTVAALSGGCINAVSLCTLRHISTEMGDRLQLYGTVYCYVAESPRPTKPGHPSVAIGAMSTSESLGVNRHTARDTTHLQKKWPLWPNSKWLFDS